MIFKIKSTEDDLPLYVSAGDREEAIRKFEDLCGHVPEKYLKISTVDEAPEGEIVI